MSGTILPPDDLGEPDSFQTRYAIGYGNFNASDAPTPQDDETRGYSVNSVWYKYSFPTQYFVCVSNQYNVANWQEIGLSHNTPRSIFTYFENEDSSVAGRDLYAGIIPGNTWDADGTVVEAFYKWTFAANGNTKTPTVYINATSIFTISTTQNSGAGHLRVELMRDSSSTLRVSIIDLAGTYNPDTYTTVTTLDFTVPILLRLFGASTVAADFTAKFGYAKRISAPMAGDLTYVIDDDSAFDIDDDGAYVAD